MMLNKIIEGIGTKEYKEKLIIFTNPSDMNILKKILDQYQFKNDSERNFNHQHGFRYNYLVFIEYNNKTYYYVKTGESIQYLSFLLNKHNGDRETFIKVYEYDKNILLVNNYIKYGIYSGIPTYKPKNIDRLLEHNNDKETATKIFVQLHINDLSKMINILKNKDYIDLSDSQPNTSNALVLINFIDKTYLLYNTNYSIEKNREVINNNLNASTLNNVYNYIFNFDTEYDRITEIINLDSLTKQTPSYIPKKTNRVLESIDDDIRKVAILVNNKQESEDVQTKLFELGWFWDTTGKKIKNFYEYPVIFFAYIDYDDGMIITFLEISIFNEDAQNEINNGEREYTYPKLFDINTLDKYINIVKNKGNKPSYKPKNINRILESIQNKGIGILVDKTNIDKVLNILKEKKYEVHNNTIGNNINNTSFFMYVSYENRLCNYTDTSLTLNDLNMALTDIITYNFDDINGKISIYNYIKYGKPNIKPFYTPKKINRIIEKISDDSLNLFMLKSLQNIEYSIYGVQVNNKQEKDRLKNFLIKNNLFDIKFMNDMDKHPDKVIYYLSIKGNDDNDFYFLSNVIYTDVDCDLEYFNYFLKHVKNPYPELLSVNSLIRRFNYYTRNTLKPNYNIIKNKRVL